MDFPFIQACLCYLYLECKKLTFEICTVLCIFQIFKYQKPDIIRLLDSLISYGKDQHSFIEFQYSKSAKVASIFTFLDLCISSDYLIDLQSAKFKQAMQAKLLKPQTLFLIATQINNELYYLSNESSLTNTVQLDKNLRYSNIASFLFEVDQNNIYEKKLPQRFYEPLLIKHKYSNKFLNFVEEMGDRNHQGCRLGLSHDKIRWTMLPCYKYQIKNTLNVCFSERIYISQENSYESTTKNMFVKQYSEENSKTYDLLFGFHFKSQMVLIKYHENDEHNYHFGQYLKVYHQESYSFLVDSSPINKIFKVQQESNKEKFAVAFKNQEEIIGETLLDCIWSLEEAINIKGSYNINGVIKTNLEVKLKNPLTDNYLTLMDNSTDDQNYSMVGQRSQSIYSVFLLEPVRQSIQMVTKDAQIRMKQTKIYQYMAVSSYRQSHVLIDIVMDRIAQDEHFYEFKPIKQEHQITIYFLVSLKKELEKITKILAQDQVKKSVLEAIKGIYLSLDRDLKKLESNEANIQILQKQLRHFIPLTVKILTRLQTILQKVVESRQILLEIVRFNYVFLFEIVKEQESTKIIAFKYIHIFLKNLFQQLFVEELLVEMFKDNMSLLSRASEVNSFMGCNLIEGIFKNIVIVERNSQYLKKIMKIITLLFTFAKIYENFIDINQRLIVIQLFGEKRRFDHLLFPIKIRKSHIYINHPTNNIQMPINNIRQPSTVQLIVKTLSFVSSLCEDRNIISKKLVSNYLCHEEERTEDLKFIINCFYIKGDFSLRAIILLLLANLYVDSFPRINRYSPVAVIKMNIESMKIKDINNADTEIAELSARLKDSIMQKAERSYTSRPLNTNAFVTQEQSITKAQPTFTQNQMNQYKKVIILLLETQEWNIQILRILRMLLNLSILSSEQKVNIYSLIFDKISLYGKNSEVIKEILLLLEDSIKYLQEETLERVNIYFILMHFQQKAKIQANDVKYLILNDQYISLGNQAQNFTNKYTVLKYNESSAKTSEYYKQINKVQPILQIFLDNTYDPLTMLKFLYNIKLIFTPCYQTAHLLLNTSIISEKDLDQYELLQSYSIQINNLTKISEEWLCNDDENSQDYLRFSDLMTQLTNYLYDDYVLDSYDSYNYRKKHKINKNRQSIMKNIGVHIYILSLLNTNYYLLEGESLRSLSKKIRQTFEKCFNFLYQFCFDCEQNKQLMISQMAIIKKFMSVLETGQTQFWILLIKNRKKLIQQTQLEDFQRLFFKIIKDRNSTSGINCDYNPSYIQQLMALIDINGKPFRPNIDKIARVLSQPLVFKKILYLSQQKKKRMEFCIQLYKLRIDPTQIPVIYQTKVLQFLIYLMKQLGSKNSFMKRSLKNIISLDYIFFLLSAEDSFLFQGIPTDITFIFKIQLLRLLQIYLFTKDIETQVYNCIQLTKCLEYYKTIFTINQKRKLSMVDNQMLYYSYIQKYEDIIEYYVRNNSEFYNKYLKKSLKRLLEILQKVPEKEADQNYQLVVLLLDESQLSNFKKDPLLTRIEKQRDIYIKWSNFTVMSENSPDHEKIAKNQLFQLLSHELTAKYLQQQKIKFFQSLQAYENKFIDRICLIVQSLHENFQIFHQEPLYQLVFLLHQFITFKTNKQEKPFSIKPPTLKLQKSFGKIVMPLVKLLCNRSFDFNRIFCRKIFYYSLSIISTILSLEVSFQLHEQILNYLNINTSKGLLDCIKITLSQTMEQEKIESLIQEINISQEELHLLTQEKRLQLMFPSLLFIKQLCRLSSFTSFLRFQQNTVNIIDLLDLIFTNLLFILSQETNQVNMFMVERVEYLCQAIVAFFTGCNKQNQLFVVNKQIIKYAENFLKIDKIKLKQPNKEDLQAIISKISEYYKSTIPEYRQILQKEVNYFRFSHHFPTNCLKSSLVKVFLSSTIGNEIAVQKLRNFVSLQLLKLNIIIAYQQLLSQQKINQEKYFLQKFEDWRYVFENPDQHNISLVFPIYALALISVLEEESSNKQHASANRSNDEGQPKQQNIEDILPPSIKLLLKQLKDEPFFRDILLFYEKYFESYKFFKQLISSIQVSLGNGNKIVNITFPRLPMCNQIDDIFQYELQHSVNRLNQQQKNKSFLILAEQFYEQIQGEIQFNAVLFKNKEYLVNLLNIFEKSQKFNMLFCLLNILITILYLVGNFQHYSTGSSLADFQQESFVFYQPQTVTRGFLLLLEIINVILCFLLIVFVALKKLPFFLYLHLKSYHKLQPKERIGLSKFQITHGVYEVINTISLDLYLILFSLLSISHPMFCSFIIIYIATRLQTGKVLIKMASSLAFELLAVTGVLVVFNYIFAIIIYVNFTVGTSYGAQCINMFVCMKLFMDQIIKGGFVTLLPSNYINNTVNAQFFTEYSYNILVPGVLLSIFRGLLIDKMSFLRENNQLIEKDEKTKCFICGQSQFEINLNLQGFERHLNQTHNRKNYMGFMFYLKRKHNGKYLFYEDLVRNSISRLDYAWIPLQTSIQKQKFSNDQQETRDIKEKMKMLLQDKHDQFKRTLFNTIRAKNEITQIFQSQENDRMTLKALFSNSFLFKSEFNENRAFK